MESLDPFALIAAYAFTGRLCAVLGERVTPWRVAGAVLVVAGVALAALA